jgi:hypothetical protein
MRLVKTLPCSVVFLLALSHPMSAQIVWTQILSSTNPNSNQSGVYKVFNNGYSETTGTDIAQHPILSVPLNGQGAPQSTGGYDSNCESAPSFWTGSLPPYRYPEELLQSNYITNPGIIGLEFLGTVGSGSISSPGSGSNLIQSVFFSEQPCYFGGREYGFVYNRVTGNFQAYWGTNENCGPCSGMTIEADAYDLPNSLLNQNYYFEMWPVFVNSSTCYFELEVQGPPPSYTVEWGPYATQDVNSAIRGADSNFCTAIKSESGYITAGIVYQPTIGSIASSNALSLTTIKVGLP